MLLTDAAELAERRGQADLVIVVGDTAYAGTEAEYRRAGEWLDQLTKAVKCGETDVRLVPGNHDCDRSQIALVGELIHRRIRQGTSKSAHSDLERLAKDAEEVNPLLPKLRAYRTFAMGYDSDFDSVGRPVWTKDLPLLKGIVLRLVGMNSVQVSDNEDRPGAMILGNSQYILPAEPNVVYAVIMHHPTKWLMDEAEAQQYLRNRARVIMVGHEHIPSINLTRDELKNEWLDIYSGATNPPESSDLYRFTYNWVEVSLRETASSHVLVVSVLPRVWVPERARFAPDTQRLAGEESAEFEIACPGLKPAPPQATTQVKAAPSGGAGPDVSNKQLNGEPMPTDDEASLAKLKFLFWRYLDWQQRLKVLVQADVLPRSADRPVPQTLERLALERARQQGNLARVWDAMMAYVPEGKQQPNPFRQARS